MEHYHQKLFKFIEDVITKMFLMYLTILRTRNNINGKLDGSHECKYVER